MLRTIRLMVYNKALGWRKFGYSKNAGPIPVTRV